MDGLQKLALTGHYSRKHGHEHPHAAPQPPARGTDDKPEDAKPPGSRKYLYIAGGVVLVVALIVGGTLYWLHARQFESTDDAFIDGHSATIAPQIGGRVTQVAITDNQMVDANQLLVVLDARDQQIKLDQAVTQQAQAAAQLEQARAQTILQQATIDQNAAQIRVGEAELVQAQQDYNRFRSIDPKAITRQQLDNAQANLRTSEARLDSSRHGLDGAVAQLAAQKAQVTSAEAALAGSAVAVRNAQLQLTYAEIRAPEAGRVTRRIVEPGNYINPGQMMLNIVRPSMWITANFKETQLAHMQIGQPVEITVDALPDKTFHGKIDSFQAGSGAAFSSLPAENATGNFVKVVARIPVKIVLDEASDPKLSLGMSATPRVTVR